ncbi:hypothetical protein HJC23_002180 [Cyclotella cryptica]|uniref:non-specific serine/threonine protein kinase n=1 Tax=Cyclotella cryptica TaxID=29204 RepID=A0ABD3Q5T0_9STRA|eukprot:CCRYP_008209-RA/>CCRYP_008209-RA protein AED:0.33 eAED:0.33 QI:0/-1/0/1/-1/1/1/0/422
MLSPAEESEPTWFGPPPPAELLRYESSDVSPHLLSQGAEARVWLLHLPKTSDSDAGKATVSVGSGISVPKLNSVTQLLSISPGIHTTICKERFPKKYRHPQLDISLTKSRTKAEARCLIRCQRAGVPCPNVLAIAHWSNEQKHGDSCNTSGRLMNDKSISLTETSNTSSCLFLEYIHGCTVRHYLEERSNPPSTDSHKSKHSGEPEVKRARCGADEPETIDPNQSQEQERITTVIDKQTLLVARTLGALVAKMHAAGVIHGDLTTSNVMLRNPPSSSYNGSSNNDDGSWTPQLVLIDFGLATSTSSILPNESKTSSTALSNKQKPKQHKQQHNAEEKAVDLYVLERAFLSTHPESELLVEEVWRGYRSFYEGLDNDYHTNETNLDKDRNELNTIGAYSHVVNSVMNRLEQVRLRGRKRECFG